MSSSSRRPHWVPLLRLQFKIGQQRKMLPGLRSLNSPNPCHVRPQLGLGRKRPRRHSCYFVFTHVTLLLKGKLKSIFIIRVCAHTHTLTLTDTEGATDVSGVSGTAEAFIGSLRVHTPPVLTQIPHHLTFINICTKHRHILLIITKIIIIINNHTFQHNH